MGNAFQSVRHSGQAHVRLLLTWLMVVIGAALSGCASTPRAHGRGSYCVSGHGCYQVLPTAHGYDREGVASWYGMHAAGKPTASGEPYDPRRMTAASKVLPFGTWVRITDLDNGRQAVAMVNDRGPFYGGRILDVSIAVAHRLAMMGPGTAHVRVTAIPESRLTYAQREAARHNAALAVRYSSSHPVIHALAGGAGLVLRGSFDVVRGGVDVGMDLAGGVLHLLLP